MSDERETDAVWRRAEIESPCIKVCVLHPEAGICLGCYRTREEIARWSRFTAEERTRVMAELPGRSARLPGRRGGARRRRSAG